MSQMSTEVGGARQRVVSRYIRSKLRGACTHICTVHVYILTYVCMIIEMLWSNDLQVDYTVTYSDKSSAVLHTAHLGYVEDLLANRAAVGHTLHRTHYQWFSFFFLLSPFSNTLVDFRPFLRSEVFHTGRGGDRICSNATHSHPQHLQVAWRDWGGGEHSVTSPHESYDGRWTVILFNHCHYSLVELLRCNDVHHKSL